MWDNTKVDWTAAGWESERADMMVLQLGMLLAEMWDEPMAQQMVVTTVTLMAEMLAVTKVK